ncbi:MAG: glycosyltransferase [Gluconacetobacter diazotrophicus]|nr:glycosyltransferase [Gluconacetobacter diazotrophicus]
MPDQAVPVSPDDQPDPARAEVDGVALLLASRLDPAFVHPALAGVDSAWYGHLPFASWLVRALRPAVLVELGTHHGVSYAGFCQAVQDGGLSTRCFAVDSWQGDEHAGFYGAEVLEGFRAFHDARFGAFSRLLPMRFAEALPGFADGSVSLLHIDGRHREADIRGDLDGWLPKLAPNGVVLLHDTNVRERGFGVWRVWAELRETHPGFEFLHGHGLGVLAPRGVPDALRSLFAAAADPERLNRLRERFAFLGGRWEAEHAAGNAVRQVRILVEAAEAADRSRLEAGQPEAQRLGDEAEKLRRERNRLRDELAWTKADRFRSEQALARAESAAGTAAAAATAAALTARDAEAVAEAARRERDADAARMAERCGIAEAASREMADRARILEAERDRLRAAAAAAAGAARDREDALRAELDGLRRVLDRRDGDIARLLGSRSWKLTRPLRALSAAAGQAVPLSRDELAAASMAETFPLPVPAVEATPFPEPDEATADPVPSEPAPSESAPSGPVGNAEPVPAPTPPEANPDAAAAAAATKLPPAATAPAITPARPWRPVRRILFVAGEPNTPGEVYRVRRAAAACRLAGYEAEHVDLVGVGPDNLARADLLVIWRATWSDHVGNMIAIAHRAGTRVCFDVDDLVMRPDLASETVIDGIRTTSTTETQSQIYFGDIRRVLSAADLCTVTTEELAAEARGVHPVVHVIPNGFDAATEFSSRHARRTREERSEDGRVRIGYAGGTRTHQKDFATVAAALARVLELRPEATLVLFRDGRNGEGLVLLHEFPALLPLADRIEWRDMVPLDALPGEMARFDVSICPLERDNPFCESKSELKWFESALAGVPLVATPTGPFRRAIRNGITGFLPENAADWERVLLQLVDDPSLRRRVARNARHEALWRFGPRRQAELWAMLLGGLDGGASGARITALQLARGGFEGSPPPEIPDGELLFSFDALGVARVTVGMTSYNYARHLPDTLASVLGQTLRALDLVVVDDGSSDGSVELLLDWAERERLRFNRLRILRTVRNAGLGGARNLVFAEAETPFVMVLDSDNRLAPEACETLLAALDAEPLAAFSYPTIRQFRDEEPPAPGPTTGEMPFDPGRLASGNYVDAMAMVARWAWAAAGGYYVRRDAMGWEDFTLWCRLVELGQFGVWVPDELAFYRVHAGSMVNAITERTDNKRRMVELAEARHPWLRLSARQARQRS